MSVKNEIQPLEINGLDTFEVGEKRRLIVASHWVYTDRVHLKFGVINLVVKADDLQRAIANARNHS